MKVLAVALHLKLGFGMILLEQSQQPMLGVSVSLVGTPLKCHHPLWNGLQKKRENHPEIRLDIMVWLVHADIGKSECASIVFVGFVQWVVVLSIPFLTEMLFI